VAYEASAARREAVPPLLPRGVKVVCPAERGFAATGSMAHRRRVGGPFRIRLQASVGGARPGQRPGTVEDCKRAPGRARFLHHVAITAAPFGPVSWA
jgi:hypothetical protein